MSKEKKESAANENKGLDRRDFLQGSATLPVLGLFGYALHKKASYDKALREEKVAEEQVQEDLQPLNIALLGAGEQGYVLLNAMLKLPNLNFKAVCDIWEEFNLKKTVNILGKYGHEVNGYVDYRDMLEKEKDLDAVVIATPDFWHAEHAIACMEAGLDVYCEKEMSNTLEGARKMAEAARRTGKLLQIGHQRRSHPKYIHSYEHLLTEAEILGRIITVNGQWNRSAQPQRGWSSRYEIPQDRLKKYGFDNMRQFRNWRWFKGLGGGPIVDLGSHQIDIYNWFLGSNPVSVSARGGHLYYPKDTHEWYDTVMVIYEYETPKGPAQAFYQTQTTNSSQGYFETFMGDQGTLVISESGSRGSLYREPTAPAWDEWIRKGYISPPKIQEMQAESEAVLDVRETLAPDEHKIPIVFNDPYHLPHLSNFFNTVRGLETLNCPAEIGYETAVAVLKVNESIEANRKLPFSEDEFHV
ncbi:gfo/Idh/MocA family oxidoreductase [candidate division KSB1 bacterium]|nr:gfo/Idh/MocA family oxidoreductase [candidate division KSB1 bacterium]